MADLATLVDRLARVEERIAAACGRSGRQRSNVTLVAVTKTISAELAAQLPALGLVDLAESRPQELWRKAELLPANVRWHFIGHLQRNKVPQTLPLIRCIHSIDSFRLLEAIEQEASRHERQIDALLEVNISGEASKGGFTPEELLGDFDRLLALNNVHLRGLMTMAPNEADPEQTRPTFAGLRELRDRLQTHFGPAFTDLSMGMSNDFEIAIEEGATLIRLGSVLFEDLT